MGEIPWQNISLWLLMKAAQQHPEWSTADCSYLASRAEEIAIARGVESVAQGDVRIAVAETVAAQVDAGVTAL